MTAPGNQQNLDDLWTIQVSLVEQTAEEPNPTLELLHTAFIEEFGYAPGIDLVDYFISMVEISQSELNNYLKFTGIYQATDSVPNTGPAKSAICSSSSTVLQFLGDFKIKYGVSPSERLTELFLEKTKNTNTPRDDSGKTDIENQQDFTRKIADTPRPTVFTFRKQFIEEFGFPPSEEITKIFLERMQDKNQEDEVYFAKTGANGSLSTVLEFRQTFAKTYGKTPSEELIKIFITNRTSGNKPAG